MVKVIVAFLMGVAIGLVFADQVFPDGFNQAAQRWADDLRDRVPGR